MKRFTRFISMLLCIVTITTAIPVRVLADTSSHDSVYSIDNGYIRVEVSGENGGFVVNTEEGDLLKKSDNNKKLLFHNGQYDTSFVSFRVDYGEGRVEDYIFGGKYGNISDPSRLGVQVSQAQANGDIVATWSVGQLIFTQNITLANEVSSEHGMVSIQLEVENQTGTPVDVKARILLDTCLGDKDFAYYQVLAENLSAEAITSERVLDGSKYALPQNFYAMDDPLNAGIMAYTVNNPTTMPYQIAFGHWNNLASTLFDFTPDSSLNFTNVYNEYLTADSAYALYYDLNSIASSKSASLISFYGVYSRHDVPAANSVAIDATVPIRLELNPDKTGFIRLSDLGSADFAAGVVFENYASETAMDLENITLAVQTTSNLRVLSDSGGAIKEFDDLEPVRVNYSDVKIGNTISKQLYFQAHLSENAAYERITFGVYDVSSPDGELADDRLLGEKVVYILLPGSDGAIPKVTFSSMTPEVIYTSGTRHLFVALTNASMLDNRANWNLYAYSVDGKIKVDIPENSISISGGIMDIALKDDIKLAPGSWYLQLEWTDAVVTSGLVPAAHQKQTASQLRFVVSEDKKHKNESYGVLCVVEYNKDKNPGVKTETYNHDSMYRLVAFEDEDAFKEFSKETNKYVEILLIFRGEFTGERKVLTANGQLETTYYSAVSTKHLDTTTRQYIIDNPITINGCMDFEAGTMAVYYEDYLSPEFRSAAIMTEFDGDLLTSDARTSVWKGKAIFTKIEQKKNFSLRPYDINGNRKENFNDATIQLIWPSVYGLGQTLAGMIFKLAYGELGVVIDTPEPEEEEDENSAEAPEEDDEEETELGRVLSFTASFSLSFLNPKEGEKPRETYWTKMQELFEYHTTDSSLYEIAYGKDKVNQVGDFTKVNEDDEDDKGWTGSVMVQDVLFGCGVGFYGVKFKVDVGIQNYIDSLPKIKGTLEVNTVNNWAFSFEGEMEMATFSLEAKLSFKSYKNFPVPDEVYFFAGGFKPGINIDTYGVIWITGGGGGISDLYESIFLKQGLPPFKLILAVSFNIAQVMDATAKLGIGLTGISLEASDIKVMTAIKVIPKLALTMEWYPDLDLKGALSIDLFQGVIKGNGYIVLIGKGYTDWFFEMYAKAALKIPISVPAVGGMTIAAVDLGINTEKIWGGFQALSIAYGITYYWGELDVDFTTGANKAKPTFPDLLGQKDLPIYYDTERNQTLFAHFGTNISAPVEAEVIAFDDLPKLMDASLNTAEDYRLHKFNLGVYNPYFNNAAIVQIIYDADDLADARTKAGSFEIKDARNGNVLIGNSFPLMLLKPDSDGEYRTDDPQNAGANANITYNEETGKASLSFTVTNQAHYNKDWYISTGEDESNVMLYNVQPLPKMESISGSVTGSEIDLSWTGSSLHELDKISFYLSESNDPESFEIGFPLAIVDSYSDLMEDIGSKLIDIPSDIPSGEYYIRAVYSKEDAINGVIYSTDKVVYVNDDTPGEATVTEFAPAGNLEYRLTIAEPTDGKTEGYMVSIYNADGSPTDLVNLAYDKAESGDTIFTIGGSYTFEGKNYGLEGGKQYYATVVPYNLIDNDKDGEPDSAVYGLETQTEAVTLPTPSTPQITISADKTPVEVTRTQLQKNGESDEPVATQVKHITYRDNTITLTAISDEAITGKWNLDDAQIEEIPIEGAIAKPLGEFSNTKEIEIELKDLSEGQHTLEIAGKNAAGDGFRYIYNFVVDTTPPRFMLTSPLNGSFFGQDGKVLVSGITDNDAHFTIVAEETALTEQATLISNKTIEELNGTIDRDGVFQFTIDLPDYNSASKRDLSFMVSDAAGNTVVKNVSVTHGGLAELEDLQMLVDGSTVSTGNIPSSALATENKQLSLLGVTADGTAFQLNDGGNVSWLCQPVLGNATVDQDGLLTLGQGAQGMVVGQLEVSEGYYRTVAMSFGSEVVKGTVAVSATLGGRVSGGGLYEIGEPVTLTATPDEGYNFIGWTITGVSVADLTQETLTFTMPEQGNIIAEAAFEPIPVRYGEITVEDKNVVYDGKEHGPNEPEGLEDDDQVWYKDGDDWVKEIPEFTDVKFDETDKVTHYEVYTKVKNPKYDDDVEITSKVTIELRDLTVKANYASKPYDGEALKDENAIAEDLADDHYLASVTVTGSQTEIGFSDNVVSNAKVEDANGDDVTLNYAITYVNGKLTVTHGTEQGPTITVAEKTVTYDGQGHIPNTPINLESSDEVMYKYGEGSWSTDKPVFTDVKRDGSGNVIPYTVNVKVVNLKYLDRELAAKLTIEPKAITVKANNASKAYDGTALTLENATTTSDKATAADLVEGHKLAEVIVSGSQTAIGESLNKASGATIKDAEGNEVTSNYAITYEDGKLIVTHGTAEGPEITVANKRVTYDGEEHSIDDLEGLVAGDEVFYKTKDGNWIKTKPVFTDVNRDAEGNVIAYQLEAKVTNLKYMDRLLTSKLTIEPKAVTVKANNASKAYDGTALTLENATAILDKATAEGLLGGHKLVDVTVKGSQVVIGESVNKASDAIIKNANGTEVTSNYAITYEDGKLIVTHGTAEGPKVTVESKTVIYDGKEHSINVLDGLAAGDEVWYKDEDDNWVKDKPVFTDVNRDDADQVIPYQVEIKVVNLKYADRELIAKVTIEPKAVTVKANNASKAYDGTALTLENATAILDKATAADLVEGHILAEVNVSGSQTEIGESSNVASDAKLEDANGTEVTHNYAITYEDGRLIVTHGTAEGPEVTGADKRVTYNGEEHSINDVEGLVAGDEVFYKTKDGNWIKTKPVFTDVNRDEAGKVLPYEVSIKVVNLKYADRELIAKVTIEPKAVTVKASNASKAYDGTALTLENATTTSDKATAEGLLGGHRLADVTVTGSQIAIGESSNVASDAKLEDAEGNEVTLNYAITYEDGKLIVTHGTAEGPEVTVEAKTVTYDGEEHSIDDLEGLAAGDEVFYKTKDGNWIKTKPVFTDVNRDDADQVIPYQVEIKVVNLKYADRELIAKVTIEPKAITVKANNASKAYDGTALTLENATAILDKATAEGLLGGHKLVDVTVKGSQVVIGESVNKASDAIIKDAEGNEVTSNYAITYEDGRLIVTHGTAEGPEITVADKRVTYNGEEHSINDVEGLVAGDEVFYKTKDGNWIKTKPVFTDVNRDAEGNVIAYQLEAKVTNLKYMDRLLTSKLTIEPKALTVKANNASKPYDGKALEDKTATAEGLLGGHRLADVTVTGSQIAIGESLNKASNATIKDTNGTEVTHNYAITYEDGRLIVTHGTAEGPKVTVEDQIITYDGQSYSPSEPDGLVEGDEVWYKGEGDNWSKDKPVFTDVNRDAEGKVIAYQIVTKVTNLKYIDRLITSKLTIEPKTVTVKANNASKPYDGKALEDKTATAEGLLAGHELADVTVKGSQIAIGESSNVASDAKLEDADGNDVTSNYAITYENGKLTVTQVEEYEPEEPDIDPDPADPDPSTDFIEVESAGDLVTVAIPENINPNTYIPYYLNADGSRNYVTISSVGDGVLYYTAPVPGKYFFEENKQNFTDIQGHWAESSIEFITARGLFLGLSEDTFGPKEPMTRAMFVTVLHRLAGLTEPKTSASFQDVAVGSWYEKAVFWANENGIVRGFDAYTFAPNAQISREEMCVLIARYARFAGIATSADAEIDSFTDADRIAAWAKDDVAFCQAMGIVLGLPDNSFAPKANSTRGENSAVLMRLIELLIDHAK